MELINKPENMYNFLGCNPLTFVGETFIDSLGNLWCINQINILGGRPPNNGWRLPWTVPSGLFVREINYAIEADFLKQLTLNEIKEMVLRELENEEFWWETLEMPEWEEQLDGYTTIGQIFDDLRREYRETL